MKYKVSWKSFDISPSIKDVNIFIEKIMDSGKQKIKMRIIDSMTSVPIEIFKSQLDWMLSNQIINKDQYNDLIEKHRITKNCRMILFLSIVTVESTHHI